MMKKLFLILPLFFFLHSHAQPRWHTINYILDSSGTEATKILDGNTWKVTDSLKTIQSLYAENQKLKEKCELMMAILKLLNPQGIAVDKNSYFQAVKNFNSFKTN